MNKFKFEWQFSPGTRGLGSVEISEPKLTMEFEADSYHEVLRNFKMFLKGCGFEFEGDIEVADNSFTISDEKSWTDFHATTKLETKGNSE